ncbi:MAG: DUF3576 domain-containing protein [Magnetococcales bacterium]|nr:DUF3576 domain-containing protein [Magnetococcales bacterium]
MKNRVWIVVLAAMAVGISGCSKKTWSSRNKLEENDELTRFGKKEADAQDEENGLTYEKGQKGLFSLGGEKGLFGRGGSSRSNEETRGDKLFAGALDVVLGLPIMVASREGGLVSTDWKTDPENPTDRYRINIRVSGRDPYGEVKVVVLRQKLIGNSWEDQPSDSTAASHIAKNIRKKAQVVRH